MEAFALTSPRRIGQEVDKMGYKIQYGQTMTKVILKESRKDHRKIPAIKWIVVTCVLFLGVYLASAGYLDFLIPGNKEVTTAAFSEMVEDIQEGESVKEAFMTFCMEILDGAQINN